MLPKEIDKHKNVAKNFSFIRDKTPLLKNYFLLKWST